MEVRLRFVTTPVVSQLTGLSTEKLREWANRRALIPADVRPKRKGCPAQFSWQTVLLLRIAVLLRDQFNLQLQSHKVSFAALREELQRRSFVALWGKRLALQPDGAWIFLDEGDPGPESDYLSIRLDPHLAVLRDGFALPDSALDPGQLDLFGLRAVHRKAIALPPKGGAAGRRRAV